MKYIIRIIALPFWAICYLIFALFITFKGLFKLSYEFVVFGGEQITYNKALNKDSILKTHLKLEEMESALKVDPRSNCNHVWEEQFGYASTTSTTRKKCVICGAEYNYKTF
jgi:hypothetical protein